MQHWWRYHYSAKLSEKLVNRATDEVIRQVLSDVSNVLDNVIKINKDDDCYICSNSRRPCGFLSFLEALKGKIIFRYGA